MGLGEQDDLARGDDMNLFTPVAQYQHVWMILEWVWISRHDHYTVPLCMEETVTRNAEVVSSPIHSYVTRNAGLVST